MVCLGRACFPQPRARAGYQAGAQRLSKPARGLGTTGPVLESNGTEARAVLARLCAVHTPLQAGAGNWLNTDVIIKNRDLIGVYLADKDLLLTYKWFGIAGNTKARNLAAFPHNGGAMLLANNI